MALTTKAREGLTEVHRTYNAELARIRSDSTLSEAGRQQHIAAAYTEVQRQVEKLRGQSADAITARQGELRRRLFGRTGADIENRDARVAVMKVRTPTEMATLLGDASDACDESLERACFAEVFQRATSPGTAALLRDHWRELLDSYLEQNPNVVATTSELVELVEATGSSDAVMDSLEFGVRPPAELAAGRGGLVEAGPSAVGAGEAGRPAVA